MPRAQDFHFPGHVFDARSGFHLPDGFRGRNPDICEGVAWCRFRSRSSPGGPQLGIARAGGRGTQIGISGRPCNASKPPFVLE